MASFDELSFAADSFSGHVRLFPLPNFVLFPHVMQPLHLFERRYRELFEDALRGDGLIAMALLEPGWENDYEGRPALYPMACLGRISAYFQLSDGTYNVLVLGLRRVKLVRELKPAPCSARPRWRCATTFIPFAPWPAEGPCNVTSARPCNAFCPAIRPPRSNWTSSSTTTCRWAP